MEQSFNIDFITLSFIDKSCTGFMVGGNKKGEQKNSVHVLFNLASGSLHL